MQFHSWEKASSSQTSMNNFMCNLPSLKDSEKIEPKFIESIIAHAAAIQ